MRLRLLAFIGGSLWMALTAIVFLQHLSLPHNTATIESSAIRHHKKVIEASSLLSEYCQTNGSLHQLGRQMANFSSPPASHSYQKNLHILQAAACYHVYDPHENSIFSNVVQNIQTMLQGFGLHAWASSQCSPRTQHFLLVEISFYAMNADRTSYLCQTSFNCSALPRIILQSEQLEQVGNSYLGYLKLCHESPICVIWDFSDHHYRWAERHKIADSVMLLPIMHQSLLSGDEYDDGKRIVALADRPLDLVFFGSMTSRRQSILNATNDSNDWKTRGKSLFNYTFDKPHIKASYSNAKVCLILHSYADQSAGEYHRLNELATISGCIPVVEEFADRIGIKTYEECGGVVFAPRDTILSKAQQIVRQVQVNNQTSVFSVSKTQQLRYLAWWQQNIQWGRLLVDIFGKPSQYSAKISKKSLLWFG